MKANMHAQVPKRPRGTRTTTRAASLLQVNPFANRRLLGVLFLWLALASAALGGIRVVMDDNYPPFAFKDEQGGLQGILVDQWRLWEKATGIQAELCGTNWDKALHLMRAGEFDIIDTIFKTDERMAYLDYSRPYVQIEVPIFFHYDISGITGLESLRGFPVAAKAGDAAVDLLRRSGVGTLLLFTNYEAIVAAARDHKVNVFVVDKPPALYFLHKLAIEDEFRQSAPVNTGEFHRAVRKGNTALLQTLEQGFASLAPAELKKIHEKWYGTAVVDRVRRRQFLYVGLLGLALILVLVVWNIALNRVVRQRTSGLRLSEKKFRSIFENAPVGIFQSTVQGQLLSVNITGARMFGYDSEQELKAAATDMATQLFAVAGQRRQIVQEAFSCDRFVRHEVEYKRKDGSTFAANLYMRAVREPGGNVSFVEGFVEDIAERKRAEAELRRINRTLRMISECNQALVRATEEAELLRDICGLLVESGGYRAAWIGFAQEDEAKSVLPVAQAGVQAGYLDSAAISWADTPRGRGPTGTAIRSGQPTIIRNIRTDPTFEPWRAAALERGYAASAALPFQVQKGTHGALMVYAAEMGAFDTAEVELLVQLAGDLAYGLSALRTRAENQRVQEELHSLSARLLQVRDAERRHLARELHDTTAQHLAALTLSLTNLERLVPDTSGPAHGLCRDCLQLAQQAAQEIRTHSYLLHPPLLEALGLTGAVEDYVQGLSARSGIAVELDIAPGFGRLPDDVELALFRVVQECLANVMKHSRSTRAKIRFTRQPDLATLEVQDMGQGIAPEKLARIQRFAGGSGVGFGGMQERLRLLHGRLEIESSPSGTTVRAIVPSSPISQSVAI